MSSATEKDWDDITAACRVEPEGVYYKGSRIIEWDVKPGVRVRAEEQEETGETAIVIEKETSE